MATNRPKMTWEDATRGAQEAADKWGDWLDTVLGKDEQGDDEDFEAVTPRMENTSSSNPSRPRTIKAGYDYKSKTMVVVFRDGTWWEYRNVPRDMWDEFKMADSKGRYLRASGLDSWGNMGPANISAMPRHRRVQMNDVSEFANYMYSSNKE